MMSQTTLHPFLTSLLMDRYMLPWLERLGEDIPLFDFRVNGVSSISADTHKYGYTSKGASTILFKNAELRSHMYFAYSNWPGLILIFLRLLVFSSVG